MIAFCMGYGAGILTMLVAIVIFLVMESHSSDCDKQPNTGPFETGDGLYDDK